MSENQSRDDMNFKEEEDGEEKQKMPSTLGASSKFQPIKTRIRQLEKDMQELRSNINENKKAGMTIKGELAVLETTIKEKCNELCKCIMDDYFGIFCRQNLHYNNLLYKYRKHSYLL